MIEILIRLVADGMVIVVALISAWTLLTAIPNNQKFNAYSRILMAGLTAFLCAKLIGALWQPAMERPFELLGTVPGAAYLDNPGFPSDHALFAMALSLAVWFETAKKRLALILIGLTLVMGVGRVVALVHTPLDIAGGLLIALIGTVWYQWQPLSLTKKPE